MFLRLPGFVLLVTAAGAAAGVAQQLPLPAAPGAPLVTDPAYKIDASLVNLDVVVTDDSGRVLTGLKRENFRVLDEGTPQPILDFVPVTAPITVVILMEYSAISYNYYAARAADWSAGFLRHLEPGDWVALITFDLRPKVQVDFTHQQIEIREAIASLGAPQFSEVNLYDALIDTLDKLERVRGRKAILLLTTGFNSFSSATLDEVRARLRQTDATLFSVGLAELEAVRSLGSPLGYMQARNELASFAKQTGGFALFPRFPGELPEIYRSVVGYLRSEYTLTFRIPQAGRDGRYHRLMVEVIGADARPLQVPDDKGKRRKVLVYAREGYVAPRR